MPFTNDDLESLDIANEKPEDASCACADEALKGMETLSPVPSQKQPGQGDLEFNAGGLYSGNDKQQATGDIKKQDVTVSKERIDELFRMAQEAAGNQILKQKADGTYVPSEADRAKAEAIKQNEKTPDKGKPSKLVADAETSDSGPRGLARGPKIDKESQDNDGGKEKQPAGKDKQPKETADASDSGPRGLARGPKSPKESQKEFEDGKPSKDKQLNEKLESSKLKDPKESQGGKPNKDKQLNEKLESSKPKVPREFHNKDKQLNETPEQRGPKSPKGAPDGSEFKAKPLSEASQSAVDRILEGVRASMNDVAPRKIDGTHVPSDADRAKQELLQRQPAPERTENVPIPGTSDVRPSSNAPSEQIAPEMVQRMNQLLMDRVPRIRR